MKKLISLFLIFISIYAYADTTPFVHWELMSDRAENKIGNQPYVYILHSTFRTDSTAAICVANIQHSADIANGSSDTDRAHFPYIRYQPFDPNQPRFNTWVYISRRLFPADSLNAIEAWMLQVARAYHSQGLIVDSSENVATLFKLKWKSTFLVPPQRVASSSTRLATANQVSIWLETDAGFNKYMKKYPNNPGYFLHINSIDALDESYEELEEGLDYCYGKITGIPADEKYGFSITQRVTGGIAGACYVYPDPPIQRDVATVEAIITNLAYDWAKTHNATVTSIQTNPSSEKFLVITIYITPGAVTRQAAAPTTPVVTKNFNVLLYDPVKDAEKLKLEALTPNTVTHIYNFPYNYTKKEKQLRRDLDSSLEEIEANEVVPAGSAHPLRLHNRAGNEIEWSYYTHTATDRTDGVLEGMFLDYFVSDKLLNDPRALDAFKTWFENVVQTWGKEHGIIWVVDRDKPGEHWFKFHTDVSLN